MTIRTSALVCTLAALAVVEARASAHSHLYKDPTMYCYYIDDSYDTHYTIDWIEDVTQTEAFSYLWDGYHSNGGSTSFWNHYWEKRGEGYEIY
jgi:hypothetical protein